MLKNKSPLGIVLLFSFLLASCATTKVAEQPPAKNENIPWGSRVQTLSGIQDWNLKAMIGIRNRSDAGSASMNWQQLNKTYHITLFGPLGTGSYELNGKPGRVELANSSGQHFYANSPEELLRMRTGWQLPVSDLYYWVRGLPVPNVPAQKKLDGYNHLVLLQQQGWTIQYLRYNSVNHVDVPSKIFLSNPEMDVKIVINQWQF